MHVLNKNSRTRATSAKRYPSSVKYAHTYTLSAFSRLQEYRQKRERRPCHVNAFQLGEKKGRGETLFIPSSVTNKRELSQRNIVGDAHFVQQRRMQSLFQTNCQCSLFCTICQKLVCRTRLSLRSSSTGPTETFISSSIGKCMRELRSIRVIPKGVFDASGWINRRFKERKTESRSRKGV